MIFRIKHFVRTGKTCLLNSVLVELSYLDNALKHIRLLFRVRLMKHTLVSRTRCTRLTCINSRNDKDFVVNLFLNFRKSVNIIKYRFRLVRRTRADNQYKLVALTLENLFYFFISCLFFNNCFFGKRILCLNILWYRQLSDEFCIFHIVHIFHLSKFVIIIY